MLHHRSLVLALPQVVPLLFLETTLSTTLQNSSWTMSSKVYGTSPSEKKEEWIPIEPPYDVEADTKAGAPDLTAVPTESSGGSSHDDEEEPFVGNVKNAASEKESLSMATKDLKKEINIIQELLPPGVVHQVVVDDADDDDSSNDHPVQRVLQQFSKSVEPLQKNMDENVKKLQAAMDANVKPHWDKAVAVLDEKVGRQLQPHIEKAHVAVRNFQVQTSQQWENLSSSTRNIVDVHVKPGLENVKRGTVEGFENVKRGTVEGLETSKRVLSDIPGHSKRAIDQHILPAVETVKLETHKTIRTVQSKSLESYQKHLEPHVDKAHKVHTTYQSLYMGRAPGLFDAHETRFHVILVEASLRAFGKVLFCDNPVTGGFIWVAVFIGSPIVALCALSCVVSLLYTAKYLEVTEAMHLQSGDLGVNAVLVGAGTVAFFHFENPFLGWMGSLMMSTFILPPITLLVTLHCTRSWLFQPTSAGPAMPTLLIPYNLVMIAFLVMTILWDRALVVPAVEETTVSPHLISATMNGLSKVFLVRGVVSGWLILGGTLLCSRIIAGSMLLGSVVATLLGWGFGMPAFALNAGTAGYNAALTTAAMVYYFEPSWTLVVVGVFVVVLCGLFEAAFAVFFMDAVGIPITLTLGFCFATIAILMLDTEESCSRSGVLKRVPQEELSTPEEYLAGRAVVENVNLAPAAFSEDEFVTAVPAAEESKETDEIASESTPLLSSKGLDV